MIFKTLKNFGYLPNITTSHKFLLTILLQYANSDGTSIRPTLDTMAIQLGLNKRSTLRVKNDLMQRGYLILEKKATNRSPCIYRLNLELIEKEASLNKPKKNSSSVNKPVEKIIRLVTDNHSREVMDNALPIIYLCNNTVGKAKPVDNSQIMGVATEHITEIVSQPCDALAEDLRKNKPNLQIVECLKATIDPNYVGKYTREEAAMYLNQIIEAGYLKAA